MLTVFFDYLLELSYLINNFEAYLKERIEFYVELFIFYLIDL